MANIQINELHTVCQAVGRVGNRCAKNVPLVKGNYYCQTGTSETEGLTIVPVWRKSMNPNTAIYNNIRLDLSLTCCQLTPWWVVPCLPQMKWVPLNIRQCLQNVNAL